MKPGDDYIDAHEATRICVFHEGCGYWAIHATDAAGNYTDHCWTHDGAPDKRLTRERAIELVPEFVAHLGLPAGLPIEIVECDPVRVVEVIDAAAVDGGEAEQAANVAPAVAAREMLKTLQFILPTLRRASACGNHFDSDGFNLLREAADEVERAIKIATEGSAA